MRGAGRAPHSHRCARAPQHGCCYPQLCSRDGFAHEYRPLAREELHFGNFRLFDRLFIHV